MGTVTHISEYEARVERCSGGIEKMRASSPALQIDDLREQRQIWREWWESKLDYEL